MGENSKWRKAWTIHLHDARVSIKRGGGESGHASPLADHDRSASFIGLKLGKEISDRFGEFFPRDLIGGEFADVVAALGSGTEVAPAPGMETWVKVVSDRELQIAYYYTGDPVDDPSAFDLFTYTGTYTISWYPEDGDAVDVQELRDAISAQN